MISVIIPAHNPHAGRLARTVAGLRAQSLTTSDWELVLIDNVSHDPAVFRALDLSWHPRARIVREETLGLTAARLRGFAETHGDLLLLVDDDNVLAPEYLALVARAFAADASLGAIGGRSLPEFETPPPAWTRAFDGLLALRDLGDAPTPRHVGARRAPRLPTLRAHRCGPRSATLRRQRIRRRAGARCRTLLAGVTIGTGRIVGANYVVTRGLPPDSRTHGVHTRIDCSRS